MVTSEKGHAGLASNNPFDHSAIGLAGMIDKAGNAAFGSIDDHILIERHQVVALGIWISRVYFLGFTELTSLSL
jgi:hypothetical protein